LIRPARDVTGGKDPSGACPKILVHRDAPIDRQPSLLRQRYRRVEVTPCSSIEMAVMPITPEHLAVLLHDGLRRCPVSEPEPAPAIYGNGAA